MAIAPATYNMTVQRRSDHSVDLVFKDGNGAAINLTGYTVAAQVWEEKRKRKYADFTIAYTDRAAGKITISLTDTQTLPLMIASMNTTRGPQWLSLIHI